MTRSRRKTSIRGVTSAASEKDDKAASHRSYRQAAKQAVLRDPETPLPTERQLTDPWSMAKDGKYWFNRRNTPKFMRK